MGAFVMALKDTGAGASFRPMQFHLGEFDLTCAFCFGRCPKSFNCPVWHLRHCFDTLRCRLGVLHLRKTCWALLCFCFSSAPVGLVEFVCSSSMTACTPMPTST